VSNPLVPYRSSIRSTAAQQSLAASDGRRSGDHPVIVPSHRHAGTPTGGPPNYLANLPPSTPRRAHGRVPVGSKPVIAM
jgi:hypothetical protein